MQSIRVRVNECCEDALWKKRRDTVKSNEKWPKASSWLHSQIHYTMLMVVGYLVYPSPQVNNITQCARLLLSILMRCVCVCMYGIGLAISFYLHELGIACWQSNTNNQTICAVVILEMNQWWFSYWILFMEIDAEVNNSHGNKRNTRLQW